MPIALLRENNCGAGFELKKVYKVDLDWVLPFSWKIVAEIVTFSLEFSNACFERFTVEEQMHVSMMKYEDFIFLFWIE